MAEKRMFAKTIIDSDAFLDMPLSTQALYFHLSMRADDEGFVNNPRRLMRTIGAADDDLKVLIGKKFVIPFETGVCVIKHWKIHNYIRADRLKETVYKEEKSLITVKKNGAYSLGVDSQAADECQSDVRQLADACPHRLEEISVDKVRLDKSSKTICTELGEQAPCRMGKLICNMPLIDKTDYSVYQADVDEWSDAYPAIDVIQQLKEMKQWLISNPKNKKTRKGCRKFITNWLARSQNSARVLVKGELQSGGNKWNHGRERGTVKNPAFEFNTGTSGLD